MDSNACCCFFVISSVLTVGIILIKSTLYFTNHDRLFLFLSVRASLSLSLCYFSSLFITPQNAVLHHIVWLSPNLSDLICLKSLWFNVTFWYSAQLFVKQQFFISKSVSYLNFGGRIEISEQSCQIEISCGQVECNFSAGFFEPHPGGGNTLHPMNECRVD